MLVRAGWSAPVRPAETACSRLITQRSPSFRRVSAVRAVCGAVSSTSEREQGARCDTGTVLRVLLTGMSGVGKSSVVLDLRSRGCRAIDLDDGWCIPQADGRQLIDEERVSTLLEDEESSVLFPAGCEKNQVNLYDSLEKVVLLTAPINLMLDRVQGRSGNPYGQTPAARTRIIEDVRDVEPLLRSIASHVLDTDRPLVVRRGVNAFADYASQTSPGLPIRIRRGLVDRIWNGAPASVTGTSRTRRP